MLRESSELSKGVCRKESMIVGQTTQKRCDGIFVRRHDGRKWVCPIDVKESVNDLHKHHHQHQHWHSRCEHGPSVEWHAE